MTSLLSNIFNKLKFTPQKLENVRFSNVWPVDGKFIRLKHTVQIKMFYFRFFLHRQRMGGAQ